MQRVLILIHSLAMFVRSAEWDTSRGEGFGGRWDLFNRLVSYEGYMCYIAIIGGGGV